MAQIKDIAVLLLFVFALNVGHAQMETSEQFKTFSNSKDIKTLRSHILGNELSYPVVELGTEQVLLFEFDYLGSESKNFQYQLIHCNSNWRVSDLFSDEFMDGFNENSIVDYSYSENTTVPYVNYRIQLPNDDVQFKVSGNYILRIIEDGRRDSTVAMFQFSVYESLVRTIARVERPLGMGAQDVEQEIRLRVNYEDFTIDDPFNTVNVRIVQNGRPDKIIDDILPVFVKNDELIYGVAGEHLMLGGNEFRTFDIRNYKGQGLNVYKVDYLDEVYQVYLNGEERKSYKRYVMDEEMNGRFVVYADNNYDYYKTADYAWVNFMLYMPEPLSEGKVHVLGGMNQWLASDENQLSYDKNTNAYVGRQLIKQGYYDYYYAFVPDHGSVFNDTRIDGSHYQTENDYQIFVYYRSFSDNYDRLVGYRVVNSRYR